MKIRFITADEPPLIECWPRMVANGPCVVASHKAHPDSTCNLSTLTTDEQHDSGRAAAALPPGNFIALQYPPTASAEELLRRSSRNKASRDLVKFKKDPSFKGSNCKRVNVDT